MDGTLAAAARAIAPVSAGLPRRSKVPHANRIFASHEASRSRNASSPYPQKMGTNRAPIFIAANSTTTVGTCIGA